jgi:hypothetical protein
MQLMYEMFLVYDILTYDYVCGLIFSHVVLFLLSVTFNVKSYMLAKSGRTICIEKCTIQMLDSLTISHRKVPHKLTGAILLAFFNGILFWTFLDNVIFLTILTKDILRLFV